VSDHDNWIDERLSRAGAAWRSARPTPTRRLDLEALTDRAPASSRPNRFSLTLAGAAATLAIAVLVVVSLPRADNQVAGATATPAASAAPQMSTSPASTDGPRATALADGITWTRYFEAVPEVDRLEQIATVGGGFVAQGYRCLDVVDPECDQRQREYIEMESGDGVSWSVSARITMEPGVIDGEFIRDAQRGYLFRAGWGYRGPGAGLWISRDGFDWEWVGGDTFGPGDCPTDEDESKVVHDVYVVDEQLVAVGSSFCPRAVETGVIWTSSDGREWRRADNATVPPPRTFAHGVYLRSDANGIEASRDGTAWSHVVETESPVSVVALGSGFLAVARDANEGLISVLLTSDDGFKWTSPRNVFMGRPTAALATDGERALVLESGFSTSEAGAIWLSSPHGDTWTRRQFPVTLERQRDVGALLGERVVVIDNNLDSTKPSLWVADIP
jgi:hypothetical protein